MKFKYFSKNGQILSLDQATIPLKNIHYSYGFGVYETISVRNKIAYFAKEHVQRLLNSAKIITLTHLYNEEKIIKHVKDLVSYEKIDSCNLKTLLIGGDTKEEAELFILPLSPLFPNRKFYSNGVKTITVEYERQFPQAKTLNMLKSYLAYKKAKEKDSYDALLIDNEGFIREGTRTNFFAIKDKTIHTQKEEKILPGIARKIALHVARKEGFDIKEVDISLDQLSNYDTAFLTSSTSKILPVKQIDDHVFQKVSEELRLLMEKHDEFLKKSGGVFS